MLKGAHTHPPKLIYLEISFRRKSSERASDILFMYIDADFVLGQILIQTYLLCVCIGHAKISHENPLNEKTGGIFIFLSRFNLLNVKFVFKIIYVVG